MRTVTRRLAPLTLVAVLAGCGSITESITERVVEEGIEAANGEGIEVDLDTDGEGGLTVTSSDGEFEIGAQDLPDDWPADVVFVDGLELQSSTRSAGGDGTVTYSYTGMVTGSSADEVAAQIAAGVESLGYDEQTASDTQSDGSTLTNRAWTNGDDQVTAFITADESGVFLIYGATVTE